MTRWRNVQAIRPGICIPPQRPEDQIAIIDAGLAKSAARRAYELAQTEPNSENHRLQERLAMIDRNLPKNNLRLLVTPPAPRAEWFDEAWQRWRVAKAAVELADSRWSLAFHLDLRDGGTRRDGADEERKSAEVVLRQVIEDALRTPTTRKSDAERKQLMIGRRVWAAKYRPDWQAIVDEDLARFPARSRRSSKNAAEGGAS